MMKIMKKLIEKNRTKLVEAIQKMDASYRGSISYEDLVKMMFNTVWNNNDSPDFIVNTEDIAIIDHGDYQGTLLFVIPFATYQPSEGEYLMTYVGYGSCSGCDTLQGILSNGYGSSIPTDEQVRDLTQLCLDILGNTIRPYNVGWRANELFEPAEMEE